MDISSFPCTQLVFAFSLGWTMKEVNINGDFNQYIWAFSLGWTQETDVRVTSSYLLISSGKPEEVFPTNIFSVLNECPPIIYWAKIIQYNPHSISTKPFLSPLIFYWATKHSKIIVFPLGFCEAFSLQPSCLCAFIWSNTVELGGFRKEVCFSDKSQSPYEDSCESLNHSWQRKESAYHLPQLLQCMDKVIQYNTQSISTEP